MANYHNSHAYHKTLETVAVIARQTNVGLESDRRSELASSEQYDQFLELVKADLEDLPDGQAGRKQLFMGRSAYLYWSGANEKKKIFYRD